MNENAVSDSACLIALAKIGHLDLLFKSFGTVTIPPAVHREFGQNIDPLVVQSVQNTALVRSLKTQIDEGESEAIALAMEQADVFVVLDDKRARRIVKQLGLKVIGTVGLLLRAKKKGIVSEIKPILDAHQQADFRIHNGLYQVAVRLDEEA
jgi:predicted nucleic acid-binding protein